MSKASAKATMTSTFGIRWATYTEESDKYVGRCSIQDVGSSIPTVEARALLAKKPHSSGLPLIAKRLSDNSYHLPFGPCLSMSSVVSPISKQVHPTPSMTSLVYSIPPGQADVDSNFSSQSCRVYHSCSMQQWHFLMFAYQIHPNSHL